MTATDMRAYFHRRYRPANIVFAASGNVDFDSLVADVEKRTGHWNDRPLDEPAPDDANGDLPVGVSLDSELTIDDASQAYLVKMIPGPSISSTDRYDVRMLLSILADDGGSRLFWELIDTGRAEMAAMWPQEFLDCGSIFSYLVCAPDEIGDNERMMDDLCQRVIGRPDAFGIKAAELSQAVGKATSATIMASERPSNRLFGIGSRWLTSGEYVSTDDLLERYRGVTVESIMTAAETYLSPEKQTRILASAGSTPSVPTP